MPEPQQLSARLAAGCEALTAREVTHGLCIHRKQALCTVCSWVAIKLPCPQVRQLKRIRQRHFRLEVQQDCMDACREGWRCPTRVLYSAQGSAGKETRSGVGQRGGLAGDGQLGSDSAERCRKYGEAVGALLGC